MQFAGVGDVVKWIFSLFLCLFCIFAKKAQPAFALDVSHETYTVTGAAVDVSHETYDADFYSNYNAYTSTIPEPYLTYIQGYISSISPDSHYVAYVTQESRYVSGNTRYATVYNVAIGNLLYSGQFSGDVEVYKIYTNTNYFPQFVNLHDSNFVLNPGTNLVYTDLSSPYPDISPDRHVEYIYYFIVAFVIFYTITHLWRTNHGR